MPTKMKKKKPNNLLFAHIHSPQTLKQVSLIASLYDTPNRLKEKVRVGYSKEIIIVNQTWRKLTPQQIALMLKDTPTNDDLKKVIDKLLKESK